MNFRADRARELSHAFVDADFAGFARARKIELSAFVTLTDYEKGLAGHRDRVSRRSRCRTRSANTSRRSA